MSCGFAHSNGHSYETALLLSVFLGMFGIDRFYLGYPAIGKVLTIKCQLFYVCFFVVLHCHHYNFKTKLDLQIYWLRECCHCLALFNHQ